VQHSVTLDDGSYSLDTLVANARAKAQAQGQSNNSLLEVEIPVPLSMNVIPMVTPERKAKLLRIGASLDAHELVLPILIGARSVTHRVTSLEAARRCIPRDLRMFKHDVDLAFALTDYKVQGKTLEYFILSLGLRSFAPFLTLADLYVLASRVKEGKKLYVIGLKDATETSTAHLRKLHQAPALALWYHAYNSAGQWTDALIRQKAAAMCRHTHSRNGAPPKKRAQRKKPNAKHDQKAEHGVVEYSTQSKSPAQSTAA
jgi:hypothetical protein